MRKAFSALILIVMSCICASSQDAGDFKLQLKNNLLEFNFRYESEGKVPFAGSGIVRAQGNCYIVYSGSIEIWCDGTTRWTSDSKSKEVYIEDAQDIFDFLPQLSNIREEGEDRISATHKDPVKGTVTSLSVTKLKASKKIATEEFVYKIPSGKDWIVTDLRD